MTRDTLGDHKLLRECLLEVDVLISACLRELAISQRVAPAGRNIQALFDNPRRLLAIAAERIDSATCDLEQPLPSTSAEKVRA